MEYRGAPSDEVVEEFDYLGYCVLIGTARNRMVPIAFETSSSSMQPTSRLVRQIRRNSRRRLWLENAGSMTAPLRERSPDNGAIAESLATRTACYRTGEQDRRTALVAGSFEVCLSYL
jgi:hypothetical protein